MDLFDLASLFFVFFIVFLCVFFVVKKIDSGDIDVEFEEKKYCIADDICITIEKEGEQEVVIIEEDTIEEESEVESESDGYYDW